MSSIEGEAITRYQRVAQRAAVKLEKRGMRRRGPSITSLLKKEFGMRAHASYEEVLLRLDEEINKLENTP